MPYYFRKTVTQRWLHICMYLLLGCWLGIYIIQPYMYRIHNRTIADVRDKIGKIMYHIAEDYIGETAPHELADSAIRNMLSQLDPHSTYLNGQGLSTGNTQLRGQLEGIGIEFSLLHNIIYVVAVVSDGPSEKVGILPGDKIIEINHRNIIFFLQNAILSPKLRLCFSNFMNS